MSIKKLLEQIKQYNPQADLVLVERAYYYALRAHEGQVRRSGEGFIAHPVEVARILAQLQMDSRGIAAALLHDVVEDTDVTLSDVEQEFGQEIALLVDGVTKLSRLEFKSKEEQQVENLRKMFLAMAKDIRVILIKLADRLHNMRTLRFQPVAKQKEIARETLEIFAPLAHRLGIFTIKWELEDLSFRYLDPVKYYDLSERISMKRREREAFINEVIGVLKEKLAEVGIKADISGRPKHFYSIYNKMIKQQKELSEIYDLVAVRVIVETVRECYGVLGVVHTLWKPIPGRFKDYIAMPKPNMYQSLHTTVIGPRGEPFEVQIRTWEMHRTAEYGIAAHWRYKEGKGGPGFEQDDFEKKLSWLRQVLDLQQEVHDAREFMESLRIDLFSDRVYVFTPKGDVVELPSGSVPIDFAYRVHTEVGHRCIGAKVNGRIVPLDYQLKTGDIVEILTSKVSNPSRDWLNLVKTSQAKNRIRQWFKKERREELTARGRELFEKEVRKQGLNEVDIRQELLQAIAQGIRLSNVDDLYVALADGVITPQQVVARLKDSLNQVEAKEAEAPALEPAAKGQRNVLYGTSAVRVQGADGVMVRLSHCCNPLPGDPIIGYITRGRGVSVHRRDCPNINHLNHDELGRVVEVAWQNTADDSSVYLAQIEALALDRPRLAMDIISTVADTKTIINSVHARATRNSMATVDMKVEIRSLEHLQYIMDKIKKVRDVLEVKRVTPS